VDESQNGGFHLTGEYLELEPDSRIVHVERMHLPDPTPDYQVETRFDPDSKGTLMTMRMTLPDAQTRAAVFATGMERGMKASYVRLDSPGSVVAGNRALAFDIWSEVESELENSRQRRASHDKHSR
jgi:uncharacterized protein YndB with AHSA1/START domain